MIGLTFSKIGDFLDFFFAFYLCRGSLVVVMFSLLQKSFILCGNLPAVYVLLILVLFFYLEYLLSYFSTVQTKWKKGNFNTIKLKNYSKNI